MTSENGRTLNKKKLIASLIGFIVVAASLIGVAYAAVSTYTGTANNTENTMTPIDIIVGESPGTGAFSKKVYYNTVNTGGTVKYFLHPSNTDYAAAGNVDELIDVASVPLGTVTLTITETVKAAGVGYDNYTLNITHDLALNGSYWIAYRVGEGATAYTPLSNTAGAGIASPIAITGAASTTVTVTLYLGIDAVTGCTGTPEYSNVTFSFLATATVS